MKIGTPSSLASLLLIHTRFQPGGQGPQQVHLTVSTVFLVAPFQAVPLDAKKNR